MKINCGEIQHISDISWNATNRCILNDVCDIIRDRGNLSGEFLYKLISINLCNPRFTGIYRNEVMQNDLDINAFFIANACLYYFDIDAEFETHLEQIEFMTSKGSLVIDKSLLKSIAFEDFKNLVGSHYKFVYPTICLTKTDKSNDRNKNFAPGVVYI